MQDSPLESWILQSQLSSHLLSETHPAQRQRGLKGRRERQITQRQERTENRRGVEEANSHPESDSPHELHTKESHACFLPP